MVATPSDTQRDTQCTYGPGLQKMIAAWPDAHEDAAGWFHHDDNPRFDFREQENGHITIHSWTGRTPENILAHTNLTMSDIVPNGYINTRTYPKIDVTQLGHAKRIYPSFLVEQGLTDNYRYNGRGCIKIPYFLDKDNQHTKIRVRMSIEQPKVGQKQYWDEGTPGEIIPYGLHKLDMARAAGYLLMGEGESDGWACWLHNLPYLGIPGADFQKCLTKIDLNDIPAIYVLGEPDQVQRLLSQGKSFYKDCHNKLRSEGYTGEIYFIDFKQATGHKDLSALHIHLFDAGQAAQFPEILKQARGTAAPANDAMEDQVDTSSIDKAIEEKDAKSLLQAIPLLAQLSRREYLPYEQAIKTAFTQILNMNSFNAALNENRKAIAAEAIKMRRQVEEDRIEYERTDLGMIYNNPTIDAPAVLSNFTAEIVADVITDDGAERTRSYAVTTSLVGRSLSFDVPAKELARCEWIDEHIGARARVTTGRDMKSHLINAIKYCSQPEERYHYAHTGWRLINDEMVYLHANGCISQVSQVSQNEKEDLTNFSFLSETACRANVERENIVISQVSQVSQVVSSVRVCLTGHLANYSFSSERETINEAIQASLSFLDLTKDTITIPLYASLWRAPLPEVNFGVHLAGQTGWGKTELVALIQQHFGASMNAGKLPGSWESTDNSLEMLLFQAKDTIVVIDDFKPKGGRNEQDRLHSKADRVFRSIGNGSGRGRLTSNLDQRVERRPRCLPLSTGEDIPRGESLKARCVVLLMDERVTRGEASHRLLAAQRDARNGLYAQAMAGYLEWLAPHMQVIQSEFAELLARERARLDIDGHGRLGTNTANLLLGMKFFLQYAFECGAISAEQAQSYYSRCEKALRLVAEEAATESKQEKPSEQWRKLIAEALISKKAHLVTAKGENPGSEYGWVKSVRTVAIEGVEHDEITFRGGGDQIGWIDGEDIYLSPGAAYSVARAMGSATGNDITTLEKTLRKFILQDSLLASTDLATARKTITVRRTLEGIQQKEGIQQNVLHLKVGVFYGQDAPLQNLTNLTNLTNAPSNLASQADSVSSQVDEKKGDKSSLPVDYLTKASNNQQKMCIEDHFPGPPKPATYGLFCDSCYSILMARRDTAKKRAKQIGYKAISYSDKTWGGDAVSWESAIASAKKLEIEDILLGLARAINNSTKRSKKQ